MYGIIPKRTVMSAVIDDDKERSSTPPGGSGSERRLLRQEREAQDRQFEFTRQQADREFNLQERRFAQQERDNRVNALLKIQPLAMKPRLDTEGKQLFDQEGKPLLEFDQARFNELQNTFLPEPGPVLADRDTKPNPDDDLPEGFMWSNPEAGPNSFRPTEQSLERSGGGLIRVHDRTGRKLLVIGDGIAENRAQADYNEAARITPQGEPLRFNPDNYRDGKLVKGEPLHPLFDRFVKKPAEEKSHDQTSPEAIGQSLAILREREPQTFTLMQQVPQIAQGMAKGDPVAKQALETLQKGMTPEQRDLMERHLQAYAANPDGYESQLASLAQPQVASQGQAGPQPTRGPTQDFEAQRSAYSAGDAQAEENSKYGGYPYSPQEMKLQEKAYRTAGRIPFSQQNQAKFWGDAWQRGVLNPLTAFNETMIYNPARQVLNPLQQAWNDFRQEQIKRNPTGRLARNSKDAQDEQSKRPLTFLEIRG